MYVSLCVWPINSHINMEHKTVIDRSKLARKSKKLCCKSRSKGSSNPAKKTNNINACAYKYVYNTHNIRAETMFRSYCTNNDGKIMIHMNICYNSRR